MGRFVVLWAPMALIGCIGARSELPSELDAGSEGAVDAPADGDSASCPTGSITLTLAARSGTYCLGAPGACSVDWLTIVGPRGEASLDRPCLPDCADCEPVACPAICPAPRSLPPAGVEHGWDGTWHLGATCGGQGACTARSCAPAGRYTAKMCAYAALSSSVGSCSPVATASCAEVAFDWPPDGGVGSVVGWVGEAPDGGVDAGACCPKGWLLYGCTFPDATPGQQCHDPALGCASSLTCGEGCDFVVTGRCG